MLYLFLTLALIDAPPAKAADLPPPAPIEILGYYAYQINEEKGVAVIQSAGDDKATCLISWLSEGGPVSYGIGRRDGNSLWVSWKRGPDFGLVRYRIELEKDKPKLVGEFGTVEVMRGLK